MTDLYGETELYTYLLVDTWRERNIENVDSGWQNGRITIYNRQAWRITRTVMLD